MTAFGATAYWKEHGLILHGGVGSPSSSKPLPGRVLEVLPFENLSSNSNVTKSLNSPGEAPFDHGLSHHAACVLPSALKGHAVLLLVGGWTGRIRSNAVHAFDLQDSQWLPLVEEKSAPGRTDPPVGLSSHTATTINKNLVCVLGREGGVRIQRKFGQLFFLHVEVDKARYWYSEAPFSPSSRSGHTACLTPPSPRSGLVELVVFGGRDSGLIDINGRWKSEDVFPLPESHPALRERLKSSSKLMETIPGGLRHHAMCAVAHDCILIHGGRHFKATPTNNVSGVLYACCGNRQSGVKWYIVNVKTEFKRFSHTLFAHDNELYIYGGFSCDKDKQPSKLFKLELI